MDLEDILEQELKKQKVNVIEVSGGKKPSSLEKEEKGSAEFEDLLKSTRDKVDDLKKQIKESKDIDELQAIKGKLNKELLVELNDGFNVLSGAEKTASLTRYNTLKASINDLEIKAQQKITGLEALEEPDAPAPAAPDAPKPVEPVQPEPKPVEPVSGDGKPLKPRERPKEYNVQDIEDPNLRFLTTYVLSDGNFVKSVADALKGIGIDDKSIQTIRKYKTKDGIPPKARKREKVKEIIIDRGVDPEYFGVAP
jgi:hypothetical protein